MKKPEAMMFYPEAWRASPRVAAMPAAARAGYFDIMCAIWLSDGCAIADDDALLMACSRLTPPEWKKHRGQIREMLIKDEDGKITQARLREEYDRTIELLERRSKGGKKGARRRWHGSPNGSPIRSPIGSPNSSPNGTPNRTPNAKPMQTETETETISNSLSDESELPGARYDPEPGLRRFEAEAIQLAPERWKVHPAESAWIEVVTSPGIEAQVFQGLEAWKLSREWAEGVYHRWDNWLRNLEFTNPPKAKSSYDSHRTSTADARREQSKANIRRALEGVDA